MHVQHQMPSTRHRHTRTHHRHTLTITMHPTGLLPTSGTPASNHPVLLCADVQHHTIQSTGHQQRAARASVQLIVYTAAGACHLGALSMDARLGCCCYLVCSPSGCCSAAMALAGCHHLHEHVTATVPLVKARLLHTMQPAYTSLISIYQVPACYSLQVTKWSQLQAPMWLPT